MKRPLVITSLLVASVSPIARAEAPIDWTAVEAETLRHFRALVQIDTMWSRRAYNARPWTD